MKDYFNKLRLLEHYTSPVSINRHKMFTLFDSETF